MTDSQIALIEEFLASDKPTQKMQRVGGVK
jgi:hypothetical protein